MSYNNSGIYTSSVLLLSLDNVESWINQNWKGLFSYMDRSDTSNLKPVSYRFTRGNPSFKIENQNAQLPNNVQKLKRYFNITEKEFDTCFPCYPHFSLIWILAVQFKILNSILYTNKKFIRIGYSKHDNCTSFCSNESDTLYTFYITVLTQIEFWKSFDKFYSKLSNQMKFLSVQDIIMDITESSCSLLNYLILIRKIHREYFMESVGVRYLRTSCWRIRNRTSERSQLVRLLIQKQRVRKYRTKHFPCGIVFIIHILRFKFLFIVFNDRPRQNSVTRIQVKNSCKYYNISLNFCQKVNTTARK